MKSMSGRLSMSTALSRNTTLDSSYGGRSDTTSASVAQAEREIKKLKEENSKLRKEIKEVRSLYNQLIQENSHEKFDERRIMLIKSQVIQLERQVLMMSEAISSRSETLTEVENALTWMADQWRGYISQDTKSPDVPVKRSALIQMVETAESSRLKLYKNIENAAVRNLKRPLMFMNEFVHPGYEEDITLLDIASGQLDHLNLKHVAKLETKLASLYKELISFHSLIEDSEKPSLHPVSQHTNKATQDRMTTRLLKSCAMIKDCCGDLVQLSLLYPSAPWPPLKKSALKEVTCERVMKSLPPFHKSKTKDVQNVIESLLKAVNYKNNMMSHEIKALKEDLKFHKSVYDLQLEYIEALFEAVKGGYKKFEESTKDIIIEPLKDVLEKYDGLKTTASEEALREFLSSFKQNAEKLENAVEQLSSPEDDVSGSEALTQFGEDFFYSLDKLVAKCQRHRDQAVKQRSDLKDQQEILEQELRDLLDEQELKFKEHFVETDRTEIVEKKNSNKKSPVKEVDNIDEVGITNLNSVVEENEKNETEISSDRKSSRKLDLDKQKLSKDKWINDDNVPKKWNDDTSCPSTFDNMDFIYTDLNKSPNTDEMNNADDEMGEITNGMRVISCTPESGEVSVLESQKSFDILPPVGVSKQPKKTKPKKNYTPNLVVPNRTLMLRRSGSLSKLSEPSMLAKLEQSDVNRNEQTETSEDNDKVKLTRTRSSSKDRRTIQKKQPFR